jgi:hypothetical protein
LEGSHQNESKQGGMTEEGTMPSNYPIRKWTPFRIPLTPPTTFSCFGTSFNLWFWDILDHDGLLLEFFMRLQGGVSVFAKKVGG